MNYTIVGLMSILYFLFVTEEKKEGCKISEKASIFQLRTKSDTVIEDLILDKIHNLGEVKKKERYIDSISKHRRGISLIILKKPSKAKNYYIVQVGYNSDIRFEPYFTFYVFKSTLEIRYYDTVTDSVISIDEWRKRSK